MYKSVMITREQHERLAKMASLKGMSVGQLLRAIVDAFLESQTERVDYERYLELLQKDPAKADEYISQFCPVCGYKRFEKALEEKLSQS